ncbi:MAG: hypothetical protein N3E37_06030, partial [Candidatus Micrarchaeota archaeon]|nr:hypothetical protein [Candidatus Micrarchaeota archaeon]
VSRGVGEFGLLYRGVMNELGNKLKLINVSVRVYVNKLGDRLVSFSFFLQNKTKVVRDNIHTKIEFSKTKLLISLILLIRLVQGIAFFFLSFVSKLKDIL